MDAREVVRMDNAIRSLSGSPLLEVEVGSLRIVFSHVTTWEVEFERLKEPVEGLIFRNRRYALGLDTSVGDLFEQVVLTLELPREVLSPLEERLEQLPLFEGLRRDILSVLDKLTRDGFVWVSMRRNREVRQLLLGRTLACDVIVDGRLIGALGDVITEEMLDSGAPLEDFLVL